MNSTHSSSDFRSLDTPYGHMALMRDRWTEFAAFAWEKYISAGRGALVIDLKNASKTGSAVNVPAFYVARDSEKLAKRGGWPNEEIAEAVDEYDPEQDVVFIFLRFDGDAFHYNASDDPSPTEAYRMLHPKADSPEPEH
jgi:hypothetical protein